jgi:hypothetical protein
MRFRTQCGAKCPNNTARLKALEKENARPKRFLAERGLDNGGLSKVAGKNAEPKSNE